MENSAGIKVKTFKDLSSMGRNHFKILYTAQEGVNIRELIQVAQLFPCYADEESNNLLLAPMEKKETEHILKAIQADKSPGPDGWIVEFFHHF